MGCTHKCWRKYLILLPDHSIIFKKSLCSWGGSQGLEENKISVTPTLKKGKEEATKIAGSTQAGVKHFLSIPNKWDFNFTEPFFFKRGGKPEQALCEGPELQFGEHTEHHGIWNGVESKRQKHVTCNIRQHSPHTSCFIYIRCNTKRWTTVSKQYSSINEEERELLYWSFVVIQKRHWWYWPPQFFLDCLVPDSGGQS